jgi:regulator of RNase E activity RraA
VSSWGDGAAAVSANKGSRGIVLIPTVNQIRHSRESGNPAFLEGSWTPGFAGVTGWNGTAIRRTCILPL